MTSGLRLRRHYASTERADDNAYSMLYGHADREALERRHKRVVTYTKLNQTGASLRACGFLSVASRAAVPEATRGGRGRTPSKTYQDFDASDGEENYPSRRR